MTLNNLLTIKEFADKKGVTPEAVRKAAKAKRITLTYIGKSNSQFIDWEQYKNFKFDENYKRR